MKFPSSSALFKPTRTLIAKAIGQEKAEKNAVGSRKPRHAGAMPVREAAPTFQAANYRSSTISLKFAGLL